MEKATQDLEVSKAARDEKIATKDKINKDVEDARAKQPPASAEEMDSLEAQAKAANEELAAADADVAKAEVSCGGSIPACL